MGKGGAPGLTTISLDTTSFSRGSQSIRLTSEDGTFFGLPSASYPDRGVGIHFNWEEVDGFEDYASYYDLTTFWTPYNGYITYYPLTPIDWAEYSILSFNAVANSGSGLRFSFQFYDVYGNATSRLDSQYFTNYWSRYEISLPWATSSSAFDPSKIEGAYIFIESAVSDYLYDINVDDVIVFDARSISENGTWIPLQPTALETEYPAQIAKTGIAGKFGESINITTPGNIEGKFTIATEPARFEEEIATLERIKRSGEEVLMRMGLETFPIYITSINTKARDTYNGIRKTCDIKFFEERF